MVAAIKITDHARCKSDRLAKIAPVLALTTLSAAAPIRPIVPVEGKVSDSSSSSLKGSAPHGKPPALSRGVASPIVNTFKDEVLSKKGSSTTPKAGLDRASRKGSPTSRRANGSSSSFRRTSSARPLKKSQGSKTSSPGLSKLEKPRASQSSSLLLSPSHPSVASRRGSRAEGLRRHIHGDISPARIYGLLSPQQWARASEAFGRHLFGLYDVMQRIMARIESKLSELGSSSEEKSLSNKADFFPWASATAGDAWEGKRRGSRSSPSTTTKATFSKSSSRSGTAGPISKMVVP